MRLCWNVLIIPQSYRAAKVTRRKDKYYSQRALVVEYSTFHTGTDQQLLVCPTFQASSFTATGNSEYGWRAGCVSFSYYTIPNFSTSFLFTAVCLLCVRFVFNQNQQSKQSTPSLAFWMALQSVQISEKTLAILSAFTNRSKILVLLRSKIHV